MQRTLICCLIATIMLIYSIQLLPFHGEWIEQLFAWSWLLFAVIVISGNGIHLLAQRKKKEVEVEKAIRKRSYLRG